MNPTKQRKLCHRGNGQRSEPMLRAPPHVSWRCDATPGPLAVTVTGSMVQLCSMQGGLAACPLKKKAGGLH
jgi:hypothetical protein